MEGLKRQVKFLIYNSKRQFIIFWVIVILFNLLGYYINYRTGDNGGFGMMSIQVIGSERTRFVNVAAGNIIPAMIFLFIYNLMVYAEDFTTAVGFSSARKDFYRGVITHNIIISASMALIETVLLKLDIIILKLLGINSITKISYFDTQADNVLFIFFMIFLQALIFCSFINLLGVLTYKFTAKVWIVLGGALIAQIYFDSNFGALGKLLKSTFYYGSLSVFTMKILLICTVMYILGWIFARRMNVRPGK